MLTAFGLILTICALSALGLAIHNHLSLARLKMELELKERKIEQRLEARKNKRDSLRLVRHRRNLIGQMNNMLDRLVGEMPSFRVQVLGTAGDLDNIYAPYAFRIRSVEKNVLLVHVEVDHGSVSDDFGYPYHTYNAIRVKEFLPQEGELQEVNSVDRTIDICRLCMHRF